MTIDRREQIRREVKSILVAGLATAMDVQYVTLDLRAVEFIETVMPQIMKAVGGTEKSKQSKVINEIQ
jgi:hypothetical protein